MPEMKIKIRVNMRSQSIVFRCDQKMALRAFYFINVPKACPRINTHKLRRSQSHFLVTIRDALFTSLALWWLVLKTLSGTKFFEKGQKPIFYTQSLFEMVKKENF